MTEDRGFFRAYEPRNFTAVQTELIGKANAVIAKFETQGYDMTVRQIYYQLVTVNAVLNTPTSYQSVSRLLSDARLAGLVSWTAIDDRLRQLRGMDYNDDPGQALKACAGGYQLDKWIDQPCRVEVLVEKDALSSVVGRICNELGIDYIVCKGYSSMSSLWRTGRRYMSYITKGQRPIVLHLGDHDPSGIDMTRDNERRISMFAGTPIQVIRLALNMPQIKQYGPPPNPAKLSDSRAEGYIQKYGYDSWELDALAPDVIHSLIRDAVLQFRDEKRWDAMLKQEVEDKRYIEELIDYGENTRDAADDYTGEE